ncbi:hypothetical protein [Rhizobium sp.]|uniref:hypothetical protein n=1 Tax=Rhizobium sp. TaxID=391 RepID=UPI0034C6D5CE
MAVTKHDNLEIFLYEYPRYRAYLDEALKHSTTNVSRQDIERGIFDRRYQFWTTEKAACVTSLTEWREMPVCCLFLIGGERAASIAEILHEGQPAVEEYAKKHNCKGLLGIGRVGWSRVLPRFGFQTFEEENNNEIIYFKEFA